MFSCFQSSLHKKVGILWPSILTVFLLSGFSLFMSNISLFIWIIVFWKVICFFVVTTTTTKRSFVSSNIAILCLSLHLLAFYLLFIHQFLLPNLYNNIIFKYSFFIAYFWNVNFSLSMLNTVDPVSFIICAVHPVHLTKSISKVCLILTFVYVSTKPSKLSISPFLVVLIVAIITIRGSCCSLPSAFSIT